MYFGFMSRKLNAFREHTSANRFIYHINNNSIKIFAFPTHIWNCIALEFDLNIDCNLIEFNRNHRSYSSSFQECLGNCMSCVTCTSFVVPYLRNQMGAQLKFVKKTTTAKTQTKEKRVAVCTSIICIQIDFTYQHMISLH